MKFIVTALSSHIGWCAVCYIAVGSSQLTVYIVKCKLAYCMCTADDRVFDSFERRFYWAKCTGYLCNRQNNHTDGMLAVEMVAFNNFSYTQKFESLSYWLTFLAYCPRKARKPYAYWWPKKFATSEISLSYIEIRQWGYTFIKSELKRSIRILSVGIIYSMRDLIFTSSITALMWEKFSAYNEILIKNLIKRKDGNQINFFMNFHLKDDRSGIIS